jgi:hypothetical protein
VPLSFAPGEAYQFDWSHEIVLMNRMPVTVKVAHLRLCHSRMPFVRAYPRESQEMVFEAHARAFEFYRGGCVIEQTSEVRSERLKFQAGDFFEDTLPVCDAYLMTQILQALAGNPSRKHRTCQRCSAPKLPRNRRARSNTR